MNLTKSKLKQLIKEELDYAQGEGASPDEFVERVEPLLPYLLELTGRDINAHWPDSRRNWARDIVDVARLLRSLVGELKGDES